MSASGMRSPTQKATVPPWRRLGSDPGALFDTALKKKRAARPLLLLAALLTLFVVFSRIPKLGEVQDDLEAGNRPPGRVLPGLLYRGPTPTQPSWSAGGASPSPTSGSSQPA